MTEKRSLRRNKKEIDLSALFSGIKNFSSQDLEKLQNVKYLDSNEYIWDTSDLQVTMEILGILRTVPFEDFYPVLQTVRNRDELIWNRSHFDKEEEKVNEEISIMTMQETTIKGSGNCRYCGSSEIIVRRQQLRSGDEPMAVLKTCVKCHRFWKE